MNRPMWLRICPGTRTMAITAAVLTVAMVFLTAEPRQTRAASLPIFRAEASANVTSAVTGQVIRYRFDLFNDGGGLAADLELRFRFSGSGVDVQTIPAACALSGTSNSQTLKCILPLPGQSQAIFLLDAAYRGAATSQAAVTMDPNYRIPAGDRTNSTAAVTIPIVSDVQISTAIQAGPTQIPSGKQVGTFQFAIKNAGDTVARELRFEVKVTGGLPVHFVEYPSFCAVSSRSVLKCAVDALLPHLELQFVVRVKSGLGPYVPRIEGGLRFSAYASSASGETVLADNVVSVPLTVGP